MHTAADIETRTGVRRNQDTGHRKQDAGTVPNRQLGPTGTGSVPRAMYRVCRVAVRRACHLRSATARYECVSCAVPCGTVKFVLPSKVGNLQLGKMKNEKCSLQSLSWHMPRVQVQGAGSRAGFHTGITRHVKILS